MDDDVMRRAVEAGAKALRGRPVLSAVEVCAEAVIRAALPIIGAELERIVRDDDGHFTVWGTDRNTANAQFTAKDAATALRARLTEMLGEKA